MSIADSYGFDDVPERFSRKLLLRALKQHNADVEAFDAEHPISDSYCSDAVLAWLGY